MNHPNPIDNGGPHLACTIYSEYLSWNMHSYVLFGKGALSFNGSCGATTQKEMQHEQWDYSSVSFNAGSSEYFPF